MMRRQERFPENSPPELARHSSGQRSAPSRIENLTSYERASVNRPGRRAARRITTWRLASDTLSPHDWLFPGRRVGHPGWPSAAAGALAAPLPPFQPAVPAVSALLVPYLPARVPRVFFTAHDTLTRVTAHGDLFAPCCPRNHRPHPTCPPHPPRRAPASPPRLPDPGSRVMAAGFLGGSRLPGGFCAPWSPNPPASPNQPRSFPAWPPHGARAHQAPTRSLKPAGDSLLPGRSGPSPDQRHIGARISHSTVQPIPDKRPRP